MNLQPECYIIVAEQTLNNQKVVDTTNKLNRGICERVDDTVITSQRKQEIWHCATDIQAAGLIRRVSNCESSRLEASKERLPYKKRNPLSWKSYKKNDLFKQ